MSSEREHPGLQPRSLYIFAAFAITLSLLVLGALATIVVLFLRATAKAMAGM